MFAFIATMDDLLESVKRKVKLMNSHRVKYLKRLKLLGIEIKESHDMAKLRRAIYISISKNKELHFVIIPSKRNMPPANSTTETRSAE